MTNATARALKIPPSQELAVEAIRTLPLAPMGGCIYFVADGIIETYQDAEIEQYLKDCNEKGIIPYSCLKMRYSGERRTFVPREWGESLGAGFCGFPFKDHDSANREITLRTIRGGRINRIAFDIKDLPRTAFDALRSTFLDAMLKEQYRINQANIVLSTWHSTDCYEKGDYPDTELCYYNNPSEALSGLELRMGHEISSEDKTKVLAWFNQLDKKYGKK